MEAIELDKRPFSQIYWSIFKREHIILFTFFSWDDYNIKQSIFEFNWQKSIENEYMKISENKKDIYFM